MSHINARANQPRRVAVVGAGFFSQFHLEGWAQLPDAQVVGLCDPDTSKSALLAERFDIAPTFTDVAQMLDATQPDLVDVVTPPSSHAAVLATVLARALPAIADAVGDQLTVLADGGIRSGLDVVRMLALGAKGVLLGRAWAYALAGAGGAGVSHVLQLIDAEMRVAMSLTGVTRIADISRDILVRD